MGKIPKEKKIDKKSIPRVDAKTNIGKNIVFSFEALERTDYFNLDGTCPNWASDMLNRFHEISKISLRELLSGGYKTYRIHTHENVKKCPSPLPTGVELKDMYQIRFGTSKGGVHGILRDNCFYVIWLDPLHNMYPDPIFGGLRKVKPPSTCCIERDELVAELITQLNQEKEKNKVFEEMFNEI